jgi:hypothetical protein
MRTPSLVRALTWHVRALILHVGTVTWRVRTLSVRPSPKSNAGVQLPPLSVRIAVFLPFATLWDSWLRPHLACACL